MQVKKGMDMVQAKVGLIMDERDAKYHVHVLKHPTNPSGIASAIADKAEQLNAHSITMTYHKNNPVAVRSIQFCSALFYSVLLWSAHPSADVKCFIVRLNAVFWALPWSLLQAVVAKES
jgi:hypothetical protein